MKNVRKAIAQHVRFGSNNKQEKSISVKEMFSLVVKNKYIWILAGIVLLVNMASNMSTVTTYYFKYIVGDISLASIPAMASILVPFVIMFFPLLTNKIGTTNILRAGSILGVAGVLIRAVGGTNMVTLIIGSAFFTIGVMPVSMMITTYIVDTMDYGEWKNGVRIEGPLSSIASFASKTGPALASGLTGLIMGLCGYNGDLAVQSTVAANSIIALYNLVPMVILGIVIALSFAWNLDSLMPTIKADLKRK